jgi:hypothetical protein
LAIPQLFGKGGTEFPAPLAHGFVTANHPAISQEFFDIPEAETEAVIEPHGVRDNIGREAVTSIRRVW